MLMIKVYAFLFTFLTLALAGVIHQARKLRQGGKGMMTGGRKAIADGADKVRSGRKQKWRGLLYYIASVPLAYIVFRIFVVILTAE